MRRLPQTIVRAIVVVGLSVLLTVLVLYNREPEQLGKALTVDIDHGDGRVKTLHIETEAEYLRRAIDSYDATLLAGEETDYGLRVTAVDGHEADSTLGEVWVFTINGESTVSYADTAVIADGDYVEWRIATDG